MAARYGSSVWPPERPPAAFTPDVHGLMGGMPDFDHALWA
jgi:hypothetical protein